VVLAEEVKPLDEATLSAARAPENGDAPVRTGSGAAASDGRQAGDGAHTCRIRVHAGPGGTGETLASIRGACEAYPGPTPVFVHVLLADQEVVVRAKGLLVAPEPELVAKIESLLGPGSILVEYAGRA